MRKITLGVIAAFALAAPAFAQTTTTVTTTEGRSATGTTVEISPAETTQIREYVVQHKMKSVAAPDVKVSVGSTLPQTVELHELPSDVKVSKTYRYTVVNDKTVLVDPSTRKVIRVVE